MNVCPSCECSPNSLHFCIFFYFWGPHSCNYVAITWDITPCSSYMDRCFGGTYHHHLHGTTLAYLATCNTLVSSRWRWLFPPKRRFIYGLHGAVSQKIEKLSFRFCLKFCGIYLRKVAVVARFFCRCVLSVAAKCASDCYETLLTTAGKVWVLIVDVCVFLRCSSSKLVCL
jgi:hypothetical protein